MERLTLLEALARLYARQIDSDFRQTGQTVSDEELVRWVRERCPSIPEHTALEQVRAVRGQGRQLQPGIPRTIAS
jgi:hypothetical protein